ncbi:hypothetical protein TrCOL_g8380 [Triparma columacea]|uniref:Uncharacterized protein n=1 Tax=Triparma columacea TaxID=722753 RepID=A0A9W7GLP2_9STRA|nr:hypothetical protein TrCOL_g8380 [Triparma columacea]
MENGLITKEEIERAMIIGGGDKGENETPRGGGDGEDVVEISGSGVGSGLDGVGEYVLRNLGEPLVGSGVLPPRSPGSDVRLIRVKLVLGLPVGRGGGVRGREEVLEWLRKMLEWRVMGVMEDMHLRIVACLLGAGLGGEVEGGKEARDIMRGVKEEVIRELGKGGKEVEGVGRLVGRMEKDEEWEEGRGGVGWKVGRAIREGEGVL